MGEKRDYKVGERVITLRQLENGPGGPSEGTIGIVVAGGVVPLVVYPEWKCERRTKTWNTLNEDIERHFELHDRVVHVDGDEGVVIGLDWDSRPIRVAWKDDDNDSWPDLKEVEFKIVGNKIEKYEFLNVGDDVVHTDGTTGKIVEVEEDDNESPYNVGWDGDGSITHGNWVGHFDIRLMSGSEKPPVRKPRIPEDTKVRAIVELEGGTIKIGTIGILMEDDNSSLPYRVSFEKEGYTGGYTSWCYPSQIEEVTEEVKPTQSAAHSSTRYPTNSHSSLKPFIHVKTTGDLEFKIKQNTYGTVVSEPDDDGDVQVLWEGFTEGSAGSGILGEDCRGITFVGLEEQRTRLVEVPDNEFNVAREKLKVDDIVYCIQEYPGTNKHLKGKTGIVCRIREHSRDNILVKYDDWVEGHDGVGHERGSMSHYFVRSSSHVKIGSKASATKAPSPKLFKKGDWVEATKDIDFGKIKTGMIGEVLCNSDSECVRVKWNDFDSGHSEGNAVWAVSVKDVVETFAPGQDSIHGVA